MILAYNTKYLNRCYRILFGILISLSWGLILGSREIFLSSSDDFTQYYTVYQQISDGNLEALFIYGGGYELGLPLVFLFITEISSQIIQPHTLLFLDGVFCSLIFLAWLEYYGLKEVDEEKKGLCSAYTWVLCSFFMASQTIRQFISCLFLLISIFEINKKKKILFLALATIFHLSAIIIYLIIYFVKKYKIKATIFIILLSSISVYLFESISNNETIKNFLGGEKLTYYENFSNGFTDADLGILKLLVLPAILLLISAMVINSKLIKFRMLDIKDWTLLYLTFFLLHIIFLPIPLLSLRLTMIISNILLGWIIFNILNEHYKILYSSILIIIIWRVSILFDSNPDNMMRYWSLYNSFSFYPGYYSRYLF